MNQLLNIGHKWADIQMMNWWQIQDYIAAHEQEQNERLVLLMNVMAVAFGGSAKDRKQLAGVLLGQTEQVPVEDLTALLDSHLATPADSEEQDEVKHWAASEFDMNDPAFKVK